MESTTELMANKEMPKGTTDVQEAEVQNKLDNNIEITDKQERKIANVIKQNEVGEELESASKKGKKVEYWHASAPLEKGSIALSGEKKGIYKTSSKIMNNQIILKQFDLSEKRENA